ncbi:MAG: hypothetical protein E6G60_02040, partial [Actinobacteria bacterium]
MARRAPEPRPWIVLAAALACWLAAAGTARAADAPTTTAGAGQAGSSQPTVTLTAQDAWTVAGGESHLHVRVDGPADGGVGRGLQLSVAEFAAATSRSGFERALSPPGPTSLPLSTLTFAYDDLPAELDGSRLVTLPIQAPGIRDASRLATRGRGVYPLEVELRAADDRRLDGFTTALVIVDPATSPGTPAIATPLEFAWVWPLEAPPVYQPNGAPDAAVARALTPRGRLGRLAAALGAAPDVPVTIAPAGETMESWMNLPFVADGVAQLRDATASQVLSGPYVPMDVPALLAANMGGAVKDELVAGDAVLRQIFGERVDSGTALATTVNAATLDELRLRANRVVVRANALEPVTTRLTPTRPFTIETAAPLTTPIDAVASDSGLERELATKDAPALRAQRFLSTLALIALEAPNSATRRGIVVVNPGSFDAASTLVNTILVGLRGNPFVTPVTVSQLFDTVPPESGSDGPKDRQVADRAPGALPIVGFDYLGAQSQLDAYRSIVGARSRDIVRGGRLLLTTLSDQLDTRLGRPRAAAALAEVLGIIRAFLDGIQLPHPGTITLTARSGELPLTFRNINHQAVRVRVG